MKDKKVLKVLSILLVVMLAAACAASPAPVPVPSVSSESKYYGDSGMPNLATDSAGKDVEERMIVRTATLSLTITDTDAAIAQIRDIVDALDGYVVSTLLWRDKDQLRGSIVVRVPSRVLDEALGQIKSLAVRVERESGDSQDVTEEYSDLGARLRNLEATEQELLELLTTVRERTGKAEDILAVHRELTNIRGQIEQIKGRMQYLERTADMSAVTIELIPDVLTQPIAQPGWRPAETVASALRSLTQTLRFLVDAAIVLVLYVIPVLTIILIPFVAIWLLWRRRRRRKSAS